MLASKTRWGLSENFPEPPTYNTMGMAVWALVAAAAPLLVDLTPEELRQRLREAQRPVVVNVWATWCRPCVEEFPEILAFAREHGKDVEVILVSADFSSRRQLVEKFLQDKGVTMRTYLKRGSDEEFVAALWPGWSGALPATFVFAPGPTLVAFFECTVTKKDLEDAVEKAKQSPRKGGSR